MDPDAILKGFISRVYIPNVYISYCSEVKTTVKDFYINS